MIDHISIAVSDLSRSFRFYEAVLGTIGYSALDIRGSTVGFGKVYSEFWIGASDGAPGLRPHDGPNGYYAAFIRDPDGNRVEAVTFIPPA